MLLYVIEFAAGGFSIRSFIPAATIGLYTIPIPMIAFVWAHTALTKRNILFIDPLTSKHGIAGHR